MCFRSCKKGILKTRQNLNYYTDIKHWSITLCLRQKSIYVNSMDVRGRNNEVVYRAKTNEQVVIIKTRRIFV